MSLLISSCIFVSVGKRATLKLEVWSQRFYKLKPYFPINKHYCVYIVTVHKYQGEWYDGDKKLYIPEDRRYEFYKWIDKWDEYEAKYGPISSGR